LRHLLRLTARPRYRAALALVAAALVLSGCNRLSAPSPPRPPGGGGGDGGGGDDGGPFLGGGGAPHRRIGLVSAVPGVDRLRVDWTAAEVDGLVLDLALLLSTDRAALSDAPPLAVDEQDGFAVVEGLDTGTEYFATLAADLGAGLEPVGPVLSVLTGAVYYTDPTADPAGADGTTPETAFPNLFQAILTAFAAGGGNIWIREGTFADVSVPVLLGVHLYGGFAADFRLQDRDPEAHATVLRGIAGENVLLLDADGEVQRVDGLTIDGGGSAESGVDVATTPVELRGLRVRSCGRGIKLRGPVLGDPLRVRVVDCVAVSNAVEGLSIEGALDVDVVGCTFAANGNEGMDAGALVAPDGSEASVLVQHCLFRDNGADGLDLDLAAPGTVPTGALGGNFSIRVEESDFLANAGSGLLIDIEYEAHPEWRAEIAVRGCKARDNARAGVHLDLDSNASAIVHRIEASANRDAGVLATSESHPGMLTVSTSALFGNHGAGVRAELGNFGIVLSHCVLAGNFGGGLASPATDSVAVSSIAFLQPNPWSGVRRRGSVVVDAPLPLPFAYAPTSFAKVLTLQADGALLDRVPEVGVGDALELAGDEVVRRATDVGADFVRYDPVAAELSAPTTLAGMPGDSVTEDWRLAAGSVAAGAGMAPPGGAAVDAGVFGAPHAGDPGADDLPAAPFFFAAESTPPWTLPLAAGATLRIAFSGGDVDGASVPSSVFAVDASGDALAIDPRAEGGELVIPAPPGGWHTGDLVELHAGLASVDGVAASVPQALALRLE